MRSFWTCNQVLGFLATTMTTIAQQWFPFLLCRVSDYVSSHGIQSAVVSLSLSGTQSQAFNAAVESLISVRSRCLISERAD